MGIRQTLNENPAITSAVTGLIIVAAIVVLFRTSCSSGGSAARPGQQFFTVDDGKTWFPDQATNIPPYQYEGKTAYRVRVYRCSHGKEFVSHLERYTPENKKRLEDAVRKASEKGSESMPMEDVAIYSALEVKKPGDKDWVQVASKTAEKLDTILQPKCPEGSTTDLKLVLPQ